MKPTAALLAVLLLARLAAPAAADLPFPAGIQHVRVERSDSDKYQVRLSWNSTQSRIQDTYRHLPPNRAAGSQ